MSADTPQQPAMPDLANLPTRVWQELTRAVHDRHHEWRQPVLATVDAQGAPQARTVVLRAADPAQGSVAFWTHARSPKVGQLQHDPRASLVFWSGRLRWQLRVQAQARVHTDGPLVERAWEAARQSPSAGDYLSALAPGEPQPEGELPDVQAHELAVVELKVQAADWLALSRQGHRRARLSWSDGRCLVVPLVP